MKLAYVYLKSYGGIRNQEMNLDSDYFFQFDGRRLQANRRQGLPQGFFSFGNETGPVESMSAIVGENGAGKTSVARFVSELLIGKGLARDFIVIARVRGEYCVFYNFYDSSKDVFGELDGIIPVERRFDTSDFSTEERRRKLMDEMRMVYLTPHFTADPVVQADGRHVFDYSTAGLISRSGSWSSGLRQVGRYALREQLRALRVIGAYASEPHAPSEPGEILSKIDIRISWQKNTLNLAQRFSISGRRQERDDDIQKVRGVLSRFSRSQLVKCESARAKVKTFAYFAIAFLRERILDFAQGDRLSKAVHRPTIDFCSLCERLMDHSDDFSILEDEIERWMRHERDDSLVERIDGLRRLLKGLDFLGRQYGSDKRGTSMLVPVSQSGEALSAVLSVVEGYCNCVGVVDFLGFEFSPRLSSGEMSFLSMWGRLYEFVRTSEAEKCAYEVVAFLDESETALHPSWQRKLVWYTIWFFEHFASHAHVHVIFASHSPILLSDIPKDNVCFLQPRAARRKKQVDDLRRLRDTFAANVFDLYRLSFFMNEGTVGKFASMKVNGLLREVSGRKEKFEGKYVRVREVDLGRMVDLVGDPIIHRYLVDRFDLTKG